jgi:hypothetical protein
MAVPIAGGQIQQAAQVAQQAQRPDAAAKVGLSKFDQALASKAQSAEAVGQINSVQKAQAAESAQKAGLVHGAREVVGTSKASATRASAPVAASKKADRTRSAIENALQQIEARTSALDRFIERAANGGMRLNPQQLLALQARVSEYSLELDLTSKVVEKATSGLKDTLHTQV